MVHYERTRPTIITGDNSRNKIILHGLISARETTSEKTITARLTIDGGATHQVGVGEVERRVQTEVGLQHLPHFLTEVKEQTSTL